MSTYLEIIGWVKKNHGPVMQPCWIAQCKAEAMGLPHPEKNRDGSVRKKMLKSPLKEESRKMIFEAFEAIGMPNGKREKDA